MIEIVSFREQDLPEVLKLQNSLAPEHKRWTSEQARSSLMDTARGKGENVLLARKGDVLCGFAGWVSGGNGEFFGAPFVGQDAQACDLLVRALIEVARRRRAEWIRIMTGESEAAKVSAVSQRGFSPRFDFIEYEMAPARPHPKVEAVSAAPLSGLSRVAAADIDFARYAELGNLAFAGVDHALPLSPEEAAEIWREQDCDHRLSRVWADQRGQYVAFVVVTQTGYIDSVGVHPGLQGRGLAKAIYQNVIRDAAALGVHRLHSTVSSNNVASVRLHEALGFSVIERRGVWELGIEGARG